MTPAAHTGLANADPEKTVRQRSLASNALWNVSHPVWALLTAFFLTPYIIHKVGVEHYGLYILLLSLTGLMGTFQLDLGEAVLHFVAKYHAGRKPDGVNRVLGGALGLYLVAAVFGGFLLMYAAPWVVDRFATNPKDTDLAVRMVRMAVVGIFFGLLVGVYSAVPRALEDFRHYAGLLLAHSVIQTAGTLVILLALPRVDMLYAWVVFSQLFLVVGFAITARRLVPGLRIRPSWNPAAFREMTRYGMFSLGTRILAAIWAQTDRLLLGAFCGTAAVGYFGVPKDICFRGLGLASRAGSVLMPRFSSMKVGAQMRRLFLDSTWLMLAFTAVIYAPLTLLMPDFLRLWLGEEFATRSAGTAQMLTAGCIAVGAFYPYQMLFAGLGRPEFQTVQSACTAGVAVILNFVLIRRFGLLGAGYTMLATGGIGICAVIWTWRKVLKARSSSPLFRVLAGPLMGAALGMGVCVAVLESLSNGTWLAVFSRAAVFCAASVTGVLSMERILGGKRSRLLLVRGIAARQARALGNLLRCIARRLPMNLTGQTAQGWMISQSAIVRTSARKLLKKSDMDHWRDPRALLPEWESRTRVLATFIQPESSVLEFGAGTMNLRRYLPPDCQYTPSDLVNRGPGTIVCDLNGPRLPDLGRHDVVFFGGVLEYVYDLDRLFARLGNVAAELVLSYAPTDLAGQNNLLRRRGNGWVSDLSSTQLEQMLGSHGFRLAEKRSWNGNQILYRFKHATSRETSTTAELQTDGAVLDAFKLEGRLVPERPAF